MEIISNSPEETVQIGHHLGSLLTPGSVVLLRGDLGAGKTHFAKGVALGLGVRDTVTSPTFTIINEYSGKMPFYHMDVYRLDEEEEAFELGIEEYLYGQGVSLIEWPERISGLLPDFYLFINIAYDEIQTDIRRLRFTPTGEQYDEVVKELSRIVCFGD